MKRLPYFPRWRFGLVCAVLALAAPMARAQTSDSIRYVNRKTGKEETLKCTIEGETPATVTFHQGAATRTVPALDVLDVLYEKSIGAGNLVDYRKAQNREEKVLQPTLDADTRKQAFQEALALYRGLAQESKESKAATRHMRYCVARLLARRSEDDPEQAEPAIAELKKFLADHGDGWQVVQASRLLGQLQEARGDLAGAQKTYEQLAAREDVPKETRQEADIFVARMLIRGNKAAEAQTRLEKLARALPPTSPEASKVQVYLAQCGVATGKLDAAETKLKGMLAGDLESGVQGLVYNALGDVARQKGKAEDAFWDYLWVDVVYNQDKHEHAKALYYLSKLFTDVKNDPARAQHCRKRLLEEKEFLGLDYQKLAAKEKAE
jgi:tetratricopeptide (TPR) repeat protein